MKKQKQLVPITQKDWNKLLRQGWQEKQLEQTYKVETDTNKVNACWFPSK